jgi:hypothetical protein
VEGQVVAVKHRVPPWWTMVVSAWGMAMVTFSTQLDLNPGLYPIIGVAIMAAPAAGADRLLRRRNESSEE